MPSYNGLVLNYAIVIYYKSKSKIDIVREIAGELPSPLVISYFLCDNWYTTGELRSLINLTKSAKKSKKRY